MTTNNYYDDDDDKFKNTTINISPLVMSSAGSGEPMNNDEDLRFEYN